MRPATAFVILEYCGGVRTDALHGRLSRWNPGASIFVLDNASPTNRASCVTHRNRRNSYVGGGIRDCLALARAAEARFLLYCANDVECLTPLVISEFEAVMMGDPEVVLVSSAVSEDSDQARGFPWMIGKPGRFLRRVRGADLLCCLIRTDFIESFGGLPPSKGGWGYCGEIAYQAKLQGKKILVNDRSVVRHVTGARWLQTPQGDFLDKAQEARVVYRRRYGAVATVRTAFAPPEFDENLAFLAGPGKPRRRESRRSNS
jgi:hypothetical protein